MEVSWYHEILPKEYYRDVSVTDQLFAVQIPVKECATAMKLLGEDVKLRTEYPHLKRVGPGTSEGTARLLACGTSPKETSKKLRGVTSIEVSEVAVPKFAPLTRKQWHVCTKIWPTAFRQPAWQPIRWKNEQKVKEAIADHIRLLLAEPGDAESKIKVNLQKSKGPEAPGSGTSNVLHPLYSGHGPLVALHELALKVRRLERDETNAILLAKLPQNRERTGRRDVLSENRAGKRSAVQSNQRTNLPTVSDSTGPPPATADHLFLGKGASDTRPVLTSAQYYAEDLVAYVNREPCVMCSMALLHSRISCVVIANQLWDSPFGAFEEPFQIHVHPLLNHKFRVIRVNPSDLLRDGEAKNSGGSLQPSLGKPKSESK